MKTRHVTNPRLVIFCIPVARQSALRILRLIRDRRTAVQEVAAEMLCIDFHGSIRAHGDRRDETERANLDRQGSLLQLNDSSTSATMILRRGRKARDVRVILQQVSNRSAQRSGAVAVNHEHGRAAGTEASRPRRVREGRLARPGSSLSGGR